MPLYVQQILASELGLFLDEGEARRSVSAHQSLDGIGGALAVLICFLIWQFGDDSFPWPVWVAFGVAVLLLVQGWKAYGPSNRITEADVQREMERD